MRLATLGFAFVILLSACGGANAPVANNDDAAMRERARPAEKHLVEIRDALVAFYAKHKKKPGSMSDLADVGLPLTKLAGNEDYSELGYSYYSVEFDPDGKLKQAWLIATPMSGRNAYTVRMNGVSGEYDYTAPGQEIGPAPSDPPANRQPG
jgi:hypothetical protein